MLIGLPVLVEAAYTPCLPSITHSLNVTPSRVEHTLAIYLFGFSLGMIFLGLPFGSNWTKTVYFSGAVHFYFRVFRLLLFT